MHSYCLLESRLIDQFLAFLKILFNGKNHWLPLGLSEGLVNILLHKSNKISRALVSFIFFHYIFRIIFGCSILAYEYQSLTN